MTKAPWVVAGVALAALAGVVLLTRPAGGSEHPTPRPGITAAATLQRGLVVIVVGRLTTPGPADDALDRFRW